MHVQKYLEDYNVRNPCFLNNTHIAYIYTHSDEVWPGTITYLTNYMSRRSHAMHTYMDQDIYQAVFIMNRIINLCAALVVRTNTPELFFSRIRSKDKDNKGCEMTIRFFCHNSLVCVNHNYLSSRKKIKANYGIYISTQVIFSKIYFKCLFQNSSMFFILS